MNKITDERIISGKRKINSNAFGICLIGLWIIILIRQLVLKQNISEYYDIFILTIGISFYVLIKNMVSGLYLTYRSHNNKKKIVLISGIVSAMVFTLTQVLMTGLELDNYKNIISIFIGVVVYFIIWILLQSKILKFSENQANKDIE